MHLFDADAVRTAVNTRFGVKAGEPWLPAALLRNEVQLSSGLRLGGWWELGWRFDESNERHHGITTRCSPFLFPVLQCALADAKKLRRIALTKRLLLAPRLKRAGEFAGSHPFGKFHGSHAQITHSQHLASMSLTLLSLRVRSHFLHPH